MPIFIRLGIIYAYSSKSDCVVMACIAMSALLTFIPKSVALLEIVASLLTARPNCVENWAALDLCHKPVHVL